MELPPGIQQAVHAFRNHLNKYDWSGQPARRILILKSFLKLATTEGYAAVTMRSLAKAVDVKPSSIYFHFPNGRDQILAESLRWHYYHWGHEVLAKVDRPATADGFWNALVDIHLRLQLSRLESELWDLLIAIDRIGNFLPDETRDETSHWLELLAAMYRAAAREMGYKDNDIAIHAVIALLDGARSWCEPTADDAELDLCAARAISFSRKLLADDSTAERPALPGA